MGGIVVVGSINLDLVFSCERIPRPGETLHARTHTQAPGGKGANQAVAASLLGAPVALVGAVGDDPFADRALVLLRAAKVDLTAVTAVPGPTGIAVVFVDDTGENAILVEGGANRAMTAGAVSAAADAVTDADVVVVQGEIPRSGIEEAARLARRRLVVNLAPVVALDASVLRLADPLVVNEHEGLLTLQQMGGEARLDEDVVTGLVKAGVRSVVLTRGARGALVGAPGELASVPAPTVSVVDSTGAGDAFVGALAARLLSGATLTDAAAFAARVGAFACQGRGAQPSYPTRTDTLPG